MAEYNRDNSQDHTGLAPAGMFNSSSEYLASCVINFYIQILKIYIISRIILYNILFHSEWLHFISYKAIKWSATNHIVTKVNRVIVIYFEDVVADPVKEVKKIVSFLKYPIANITDRLLCLEGNLSGNFKRKQRLLQFDPFPSDMKVLLNSKIREVRDTFRNLNLPPLPNDYER